MVNDHEHHSHEDAALSSLATLMPDGSRKWLKPKLAKGMHYHRRKLVAYGLIALFTAIPFIRIQNNPLFLLDIINRQFYVGGRLFLPSDSVLLMLLGVSFLLAVIGVTAAFGRFWCGWACPQTVYLEFVFRPIERWLERKSKIWATFLRYVFNAMISFFIANLFLSYFVGVDALKLWIFESPGEHPQAFLLVACVTGLMLFDFVYFREQMCTVVCPYARLQSVMLDRASWLIGYDRSRGEPRKHGKVKTEGAGDCIDCGKCVAVCPTGIDIRNGLQLECIACAQCVDACDDIMVRIDRPKGLIRYDMQSNFNAELQNKKPWHWRQLLRTRVVVYFSLVLVCMAAMTAIAHERNVFTSTILRGKGEPFTVDASTGLVRNLLLLRVVSRQAEPLQVMISITSEKENTSSLTWVAAENPMVIKGNARTESALFITAPSSSFSEGRLPVRVIFRDLESGHENRADFILLGPHAPESTP